MASPDPRNVFTGSSCAEYTEHMAKTGTYAANGKNYPGLAALTYFEPGFGTASYAPPTTSRKNVWTCPTEPSVYYESQIECERSSPCKPGLGGSMIKCGGFVGMALSATATLPPGRTTISALQWRPAVPVSDACQASIAAFDKAVDAHEQQHKSDAERIYAEELARFKKLIFTGLGKDVEDARSRLEKELKAAVEAAVKAMREAYTRSIEEFHKTPGGKPLKFDCSACN